MPRKKVQQILIEKSTGTSMNQKQIMFQLLRISKSIIKPYSFIINTLKVRRRGSYINDLSSCHRTGINNNELYNSRNLVRNNRKNHQAGTKLPGTAYSVHGNFIFPSKLYVQLAIGCFAQHISSLFIVLGIYNFSLIQALILKITSK